MRPMLAIVLAGAFLLSACGTQMKVAQVDPKTGLLKSDVGEVEKASVVTSKQTSLAKFGRLAFTTGGGEFGVNQLKATGLFDQVLTFDEMQKLIVTNGLQDKVSSIGEPVGLSRLAKAYKPFLWVNLKRVTKDQNQYFQIIATDPATLDDLFMAEIKLDLIWKGVNDQNARYPLFNAFLQWARANP
ncbi:MAG: hypothetical protein RL375_608 [Pseudomonadota bacterium]